MKKILKTLTFFVMVFVLSISVKTGNITANAAVALSNLTQTEAGKSSMKLSWEVSVTGSSAAPTGYTVSYYEYGTSSDTKKIAGTTSDTSYTIKGLKGGTKYNVEVEPVVAEGLIAYPVRKYDAVTLPDKMTGLKQDKWWWYSKKLDIKWSRQSAADGYEVVLYDNNGKKVKTNQIKTGFAISTSFSKMQRKVYTVKARSYMKFNGKTYYSSWSSIKCMAQAEVTKAKVSGNKLQVKWKKTSGATGYVVYASTNAYKGYKKVKTVGKNTTSVSVSKLSGKKFSSKKTYYVYVVTKSKNNNSGVVYYWNTKNTFQGWK